MFDFFQQKKAESFPAPWILCFGLAEEARWIEQCRKSWPEGLIWVVSRFCSPRYIRRALHQGVQEYFPAYSSLREWDSVWKATEETPSLGGLSLAYYDVLTGLGNVRWLAQFLNQRRWGPWEGGGGACLFIDIDHFKQVNRVRGHLAGSDLLRRFAELLRICFSEEAFLCRYGGDEFVVFLKRTSGGELQKILGILQELVWKELQVTLSVGLSWRDPMDLQGSAGYASNLLREAEWALRIAKRGSKNQVVWASP